MLRRIKNFNHALEAVKEQIVTGFPAKKIFTIGITGTDGKTTTTTLIHHILTEAGIKASISSTLATAHMTTLGRGWVHRFLAQSIKNNCTHAVIEVTSIGIDQNRVMGINFDIGVLTNIANNEHLDYHGSFESYRNTKLNWLASCKTAIINSDDPSASFWQAQRVQNLSKIITYGLKNKADVTPKTLKFETSLFGEFNTYNILAAVAVARQLNIPDETIAKAISTFKSPEGRLEIVTTKPFTVIVDFAHTPQAFEKVLPVAGEMLKSKKNKLIHVFGATGDRDRDKRPIMAGIASRFDDFIFITHEDTYSEDSQKIMVALEKGLKDNGYKNYKVVDDRKEAIRRALNSANRGDVVIITGVGHQKSMNIGGKEVPWSDPKVVKEILKIT